MSSNRACQFLDQPASRIRLPQQDDLLAGLRAALATPRLNTTDVLVADTIREQQQTIVALQQQVNLYRSQGVWDEQ